MNRSKDPRPRALALASLAVETPEGVSRATQLLSDLATHGSRAELPVLARSTARLSWPASLRRRPLLVCVVPR